MRVTLHDYQTDSSLPQKDGVNLAHENIAALLKTAQADVLEVHFHDFNRLLSDEAYALAVLGNTDCVISNVGPHAHYYFYLRHHHKLRFRIIRDVRTAIWSSYLLQEHLCKPFLQAEDLLLVASNYTRGLYEKIFPHLTRFPCFRCYPLTVQFPEVLPRRPPKRNGEPMVLGYIGRLSEDKNFPELVTLIIELNRRYPRQYKLLACGDVHSASCNPEKIQLRIQSALGEGDYFEYLPSRPHSEIWSVLRRFDVKLFPSTSNLETFGRVIIEASYAGIPVICGAHAAAPELLPAEALCPVDYFTGRTFNTHFDHSLGKVSTHNILQTLSGSLPSPDCHLEFLAHPQKFLELLTLGRDAVARFDPLSLKPAQEEFINTLELDMPPPLNQAAATQAISQILPWFIGLQRKDAAARLQLSERLLHISTHPERTQRFLEKAHHTRADFTYVGGIDIELCHVLDFYPTFSIETASSR